MHAAFYESIDIITGNGLARDVHFKEKYLNVTILSGKLSLVRLPLQPPWHVSFPATAINVFV